MSNLCPFPPEKNQNQTKRNETHLQLPRSGHARSCSRTTCSLRRRRRSLRGNGRRGKALLQYRQGRFRLVLCPGNAEASSGELEIRHCLPRTGEGGQRKAWTLSWLGETQDSRTQEHWTYHVYVQPHEITPLAYRNGVSSRVGHIQTVEHAHRIKCFF